MLHYFRPIDAYTAAQQQSENRIAAEYAQNMDHSHPLQRRQPSAPSVDPSASVTLCNRATGNRSQHYSQGYAESLWVSLHCIVLEDEE